VPIGDVEAMNCKQPSTWKGKQQLQWASGLNTNDCFVAIERPHASRCFGVPSHTLASVCVGLFSHGHLKKLNCNIIFRNLDNHFDGSHST
jgi:hypothetical protein